MDGTKYPNAVVHKGEHKKFVQKVLENVRDFEEGRTFVPNAFVRFLRDWILEHIAIQDKQFGFFLSQMNR
jgi:hemerythrin